MDPATIETEIRRLAPWYYLWDLNGVRTDITPPCDPQGHREVFCPAIYDGFWKGKSVLDVGCNEGAYGLGALALGARELVGFDCREANVEKARFVAGVLGHQQARFEVASCDSWMAAHGDRRFDVVLLCGILYHLTDPEQTIRQFCRCAREWVYVTCCVQGKTEDGFTWTTEVENVAASDGAADSLMPNNAHTLIRAFRRHGFEPTHLTEVSKSDFWDGVNLLLRNGSAVPFEQASVPGAADDVDVFLAPEARADGAIKIRVAAYNRTTEPLTAHVEMRLLPNGGPPAVIGTETVTLPARSATPGIPASTSVPGEAEFRPAAGGASTLEARVVARDRVLGGRRLVIAG